MSRVLDRARALADEVLWPAAEEIEAAGLVPRRLLDALASAGLYGLTGPADVGGLEADPPTVARVIEEVAAGDLSTAFVWLQHLGVVAAVARSELRGAHLADLCAGRLRAGVALQAATRPGPSTVVVRAAPDGFLVDGDVPWVTGWGLVDVVLLAARDADDVVHLFWTDAVESPALTAVPQELVAVTASSTVQLHLRGLALPADRLVATVPLADWQAGDAAGLRPNGSLALGVVARCARLAPSPLDGSLTAELDAVRTRLDTANPAELPAARAAASALAARATTALVVATGSAAIAAGSPVARLAREALFLQVFGTRPAIRAALLGELT
ncbi:acyl-CoA dehydrogenase family protein [Petropleomorpha daqingensis]|uniref:Alkylation response protein AidB-like acyl-CoA dehydrogenase n=1 Tax=Petropleomorpha daqingensis TaxID=2026353 RepID=A0A853CDN5_9ACTN|nr:alkylation response protein AidB-like acyl-CoA dehydrogenase [Petropleomorpha daqingensis]